MVKLKYSLSFNQKKFSVIIISNACKLLCNVNSQVTECFYKTFFASINFLLIPDTYYVMLVMRRVMLLILPPNLPWWLQVRITTFVYLWSPHSECCLPRKWFMQFMLRRILTSLLGNRAFVISHLCKGMKDKKIETLLEE